MLKKYLDNLETRINPEVEDDLISQWTRFWNNETTEKLCSPKRKATAPSELEWPEININDALEDPTFETMMLKELCGVNGMLSSGNGLHLAIRTNYGSNIMPSLFGAEVYYMERQYNTLPGAYPIPGGADAIRKLVDAGIPDLDNGQGKQLMECAAFYLEQLANYPKLKQYCRIYHPDLQGAFDICEVVWGSDIFIALFDSPDLIKSFMQLITDTYSAYIDRWFKLIPPSDGLNVHYGWMHPGKIRLSFDSCMNLSPEMYLEFSKPYDAQMLKKYGGVVHSCGKVDHFLPCMTDIEGYYAFQLSQPEYNDMEKVFQMTLDQNIKLISLDYKTALQAVESGRDLHGNLLAFADWTTPTQGYGISRTL